MSDQLPIWNVKTTVVELVAAPTAEAAQQIVRDRLWAAGLTEHLDADTQDVFRSEPLDADTEAAVRVDTKRVGRTGVIWHSQAAPVRGYVATSQLAAEAAEAAEHSTQSASGVPGDLGGSVGNAHYPA